MSLAHSMAVATTVAVLGGIALLHAPTSGATPTARSQDEPSTSTTEDAPVVTLLPSTTSTAVSVTSTTSAEAATSTSEALTTPTGASSGAASSTTVDGHAARGAALLVPGDGTPGAETTTPTVEGTRISASGPSDGTLIALVLAGLVVIAGAMGVLTWRYWVATRPPPLDPDRTSTSAE